MGRVGGDEFLVLMDNTTLKQAEQRQKNSARHGEKKLVGDDAVIHVTMSVGLAVSGQDGNCYTELVRSGRPCNVRNQAEWKKQLCICGEK